MLTPNLRNTHIELAKSIPSIFAVIDRAAFVDLMWFRDSLAPQIKKARRYCGKLF